MKICSKCGIKKDESEFYKNCRNKDGLCGRCKSCRKKEDEIYSKTEKYKLYQRMKQKEYLKKESKKQYTAIYTKTQQFKKNQKKYCQSEKGMDRYSNIKNILNLTKEEKKTVPIELLELKKIQMQLKRKIRSIENENNKY